GVQRLWGVSQAGEAGEFSPRGHRGQTVRPAEGLGGVEDRGEPPGLPMIWEFVFQTRQPFGVVGDRSDVFWEPALRRRGGQTTALRHRRWAGLQGAGPVERIACRRRTALSRNLA